MSDEQICGLNIPVDYTVPMDPIQCARDLYQNLDCVIDYDFGANSEPLFNRRVTVASPAQLHLRFRGSPFQIVASRV